jgi:hypothetical protein
LLKDHFIERPLRCKTALLKDRCAERERLLLLTSFFFLLSSAFCLLNTEHTSPDGNGKLFALKLYFLLAG